MDTKVFWENDNVDYDVLELGRVGFDNITIIGFSLPTSFQEPVIEHCAKDKDGNFRSDLIDMQGIEATKKKATIFGERYKLRFGNHNNKAFMQLTLRSRQDDINLVNMTMLDVWNLLDDVVEDLLTKYDLFLQYNRENLRIYKAEINTTFRIDEEFTDCHRIHQLMSRALDKTKDESQYHMNALKWDDKGREKYETEYIMKGKTIEVKAYDKTNEIEAKWNVDLDGIYVRYEITAFAQNLASLATSPTRNEVFLSKVTDENINSYFRSYFQKVFCTIEDHLNDNLPQSSQGIFNDITGVAMRIAMRSEGKFFCESILGMYSDIENETGVASLLDVEDLEESIRSLHLEDDIKEMLISGIDDIKEHPERYEKRNKRFLNQKRLFNELKGNLTIGHTFEVIKARYYEEIITIFMSCNPQHMHIPDIEWDGFELKQTTNKRPILYCQPNEYTNINPNIQEIYIPSLKRCNEFYKRINDHDSINTEYFEWIDNLLDQVRGWTPICRTENHPDI